MENRKTKMQTNILDLEGKKQKVIQGGAAADAVRVCTICNVVCNSATVFASHLAGEKHAIKALGRTSGHLAPKVIAHFKQLKYAQKSGTQQQILSQNGIYGKISQSLTCEVCKIVCNSQETFNTHKMGKKHRLHLQKLQEMITPKPPAAPADKSAAPAGGEKATTGTAAMEPKKKPLIKEDLQVKKGKVLQGGAPEASIMICSFCDIVCNSKAVYELHIAGKKHLAAIKKQDGRV